MEADHSGAHGDEVEKDVKSGQCFCMLVNKIRIASVGIKDLYRVEWKLMSERFVSGQSQAKCISSNMISSEEAKKSGQAKREPVKERHAQPRRYSLFRNW